MDKTKDPARERYAWMPALMPGVAKLMAEKRAALGQAHVAECWKRGMAGEPGWFFAWEGALAIGTPWDKEVISSFVGLPGGARKAMVFMRNPGASDGAH